MPIVRTRLQIKTRARYLADATNDLNIAEADLNEALDDLASDLHAIVFMRDPDRFIAFDTITTTTGTNAYPLPADFMSIRRIDWVNGDHRMPLLDAAALLEMDFSQNTGTGDGACQYRTMGSGLDGSGARIYLTPDPGDETYELWYVTNPLLMTADDDTIDVVACWHKYIVQGLAAEIRERQETDSSPHRREQALARTDIEAQANKRDSGRPKRPTDVRWGTNTWRRRVPPFPNV
jgi:hypothetical protein